MGGSWSSLEPEPIPDPWWPTEQLYSTANVDAVGKEEAIDKTKTSEKGRVREKEIEDFKEELARKRALRHEAISAVQAELRELRCKVEEEQKLRVVAEMERDRFRVLLEERSKEESQVKPVEENIPKKETRLLETPPAVEINKKEEELSLELEKEREEKKNLLEERELMKAEVEEKLGLQRQIQALKDVSEIGKEMLKIRELQVKELKKKLVEINISSVMAPPEDLRVEYEKQIENIRKLRNLYEERAAATLLEHRREIEREEARITVLETKLSELQKETDELKEAKKELEVKIEKLENTIEFKENELQTAKDDLFTSSVQNKSLNSQMNVINNLFSQMLVSPNVDLDRLNRLLKENHGLITEMTLKGDSNEVAALLVDLAEQVEKEQNSNNVEQDKANTTEDVEPDISSNLTKVWRVLVELLSHHETSIQPEITNGAESCYKCVETPSGPRSVISVSKTFLTLKDLILEKNSLVKEVGRLKTLNNHLEHRLGSQEKRLSVVTLELRKTWGIVNKLKAQHKQLHTHEKILRYELHQKRCMLTELKQELEHCRDKWELAREKNSQTEEDWKKLRKEFASRKTRKESNSAESGYEEDDAVQSPPSEPISQQEIFQLKPNPMSESELSEDDIEHSDGNSFDTVIDLLDIAYLENQPESQSTIPFVLCDVNSEALPLTPSLLPLTNSEFTDGLDQIESEDLAAVLDTQFQNQLLGADYNLSLPSSSGSSPIPTENDDLASSEMEISEEDSSSNSNNIFSSPSLLVTNQSCSDGQLLFGSNSSQNVSKFLDGLFVDTEQNAEKISTSTIKTSNVPCSSSGASGSDSSTSVVIEENSHKFYPGKATPVADASSVDFALVKSETTSVKHFDKEKEVDHVRKWVFDSQNMSFDENSNQDQSSSAQSVETAETSSQSRSQKEILRTRENRLRRLEHQCRSLVNKVTSTSFRRDIISNKLDELHLNYGPTDQASGSDEDCKIKPLLKEDNESENISVLNNSEISKSTATDLLGFKNTSSKNYEEPACSSKRETLSQISFPVDSRTPEQILEARAARLKRLEDQCKSLFSKMSATSSRSERISNKLDELHESYGASEQNLEKKVLKKNCLLRNLPNVEKQTSTNEMECLPTCDKTESLDVTTDPTNLLNGSPGPSNEQTLSSSSKKVRTPQEILESRAERFSRLEEQCKSLVSKMAATSLRSDIISNKLDKLHSSYGSTEDALGSEEPANDRECLKRTSQSFSTRSPRTLLEKNIEKGDIEMAHSSSSHEIDETILFPEPNSIEEHSTVENAYNNSKFGSSDILLENLQRPEAADLYAKEESVVLARSNFETTSLLDDSVKELPNQCKECFSLEERQNSPSTSVTTEDPETHLVQSNEITDSHTSSHTLTQSETTPLSIESSKNSSHLRENERKGSQ